MAKDNSSFLFDAKMELQPEEDSFAEPNIKFKSESKSRGLNPYLIVAAKVLLVVLLIVGAFVGGYLVRRAVAKSTSAAKDCKQIAVPNGSSYDEKLLRDLLQEMSAYRIESNLRYFTSKPHIAGSARNYELAENISATWKSYGFDSVKIVTYNVLLSYPAKNQTNGALLVNGSGEVVFRTANQEKVVEPSENSPDASPPFSAYSPTGKATGGLVYANYGSRGDFSYLANQNINCTNKIVIVKYGRVFRGDKVTNSARAGAKAVLLFNDPRDFAPVPDSELYPKSWWLPRSGVQRGSVLQGTGDPLTPRYPAKDGVYRASTGDIPLPAIPAHPISAEDAQVFLSKMSGPVAPTEWQGGLNITYHLGPGFVDSYSNWTVRVETNNDHVRKDIHNVIAVIKGKEEPDRLVLLGNHRDAWVFGGIDPSSGTSCLMEMSRVLGKHYTKGIDPSSGTSCLMEMSRVLGKHYTKGWRPRRSIVLGSWGGEEYGLLGSTEWVEDNIHTLYQRGVAYVNVDSPVRGNYTFFAWASPLLHQVLYAATNMVQDPVDNEVTIYHNWRRRSPSKSKNQPKINMLGSGSDYAPFYLRTGVPSMDLRYMFDKRKQYNVSTYPAYHSLHDTFYYVKTFVDPHFLTHLATSRVWLAVVYQLAEKPLLPVTLDEYRDIINASAFGLKSKYSDVLEKKNISMEFLFKAIEKFDAGVKVMKSLMQSTSVDNILALRTINDRLMGLEKTFLNFAGLPQRPLYWHSIFAPSLYNSYASVTFPGLHDALEDAGKSGNWELVKRQISEVSIAIEWAAQFMASTL